MNNFELVTTNKAYAAELKFKSDLIIVIRKILHQRGWDEKESAKVLDTYEDRVNQLTGGKVTLFGSDELINFLSKLGIQLRPDFNHRGEIICNVIKG